MLQSIRRATPHFTHQFPGHILVEVNSETEYHCDACKTDGGGTKFQCSICNYQMHDYCTMCPSTISSFMHPHPLTLAVTHNHSRICDLCNEDVNGLFFWCQYCDDFNIHPLCTLLPQNLCHVLHQAHPLTLQASVPAWCAVCGGVCHPWRYWCGLCNFDIHMDCVSVPCGLGQIDSRALTQERRIPPWAGYGYNYGDPSGFGFSTHNAYNCHPSGFGFSTHNAYNCHALAPHYEMYNSGNNVQQGQGSGSATNNGGHKRKKMYAIIGQLALGVLSNVIFGLIF